MLVITIIVLWLLRIVIEAIVHAMNISSGNAINHKQASIIRVAILFIAMIGVVEYTSLVWYWMLPFFIFSFMAGFPTTLNGLRGLDWSYLSESNTWDRLQMKIMPPIMWWYLWTFLFIASTSMILFYGECTFNQVNDGLCK